MKDGVKNTVTEWFPLCCVIASKDNWVWVPHTAKKVHYFFNSILILFLPIKYHFILSLPSHHIYHHIRTMSCSNLLTAALLPAEYLITNNNNNKIKYK